MGYYMGDYYEGDPGFFSFLGKVAKTAVGFIPGVGGMASKAIGALGKVRGGAAAAARTGMAVVAKHPVLSAAGAAGALGTMGAMSKMRGSPAAAGMAHAGRGAGMAGMRRHRRMRVTNPKALRRAIRRAEGFKRMALRVLRFTGPHRPRGRAYFKPRKRKRI